MTDFRNVFTAENREDCGVLEQTKFLWLSVMKPDEVPLGLFNDEDFLAAIAWLNWRTTDGWEPGTPATSFPGGSDGGDYVGRAVRELARCVLIDVVCGKRWTELHRKNPKWVEERMYIPEAKDIRTWPLPHPK